MKDLRPIPLDRVSESNVKCEHEKNCQRGNHLGAAELEIWSRQCVEPNRMADSLLLSSIHRSRRESQGAETCSDEANHEAFKSMPKMHSAEHTTKCLPAALWQLCALGEL